MHHPAGDDIAVTRSAQAQHAADHHVPASHQRDGTHNLQRVLDEPDLEPLHRRLDALRSSHQEGERNDHQRELNDDKDNNVGGPDGGGCFPVTTSCSATRYSPPGVPTAAPMITASPSLGSCRTR